MRSRWYSICRYQTGSASNRDGDPPTVMVAADLEGGGRFYAQLTDADPDAVAIGMPVELTFRRLHEGEGYVNYFWKFRPAP